MVCYTSPACCTSPRLNGITLFSVPRSNFRPQNAKPMPITFLIYGIDILGQTLPTKLPRCKFLCTRVRRSMVQYPPPKNRHHIFSTPLEQHTIPCISNLTRPPSSHRGFVGGPTIKATGATAGSELSKEGTRIVHKPLAFRNKELNARSRQQEQKKFSSLAHDRCL